MGRWSGCCGLLGSRRSREGDGVRGMLPLMRLPVSTAFAAIACSNVTLARGSYRGVLVAASACAGLSLGCLAVPFVRGPMGWRVVAVVVALGAVFVVWDFLRRAPFVFG